MRITPLEVHSHRFRRSLAGYDRDEVDAFLRMVAEDYESLLRENAALGDRFRQLEERVEELSANEQLLKETLVGAQATCDNLRRAAVKESEVLISAAEVRAEKILDASHRRAAQIGEDIREMRGLRTRLATALRASIELHLGLIEGLAAESDEEPRVDSKVTYLARTTPAVSSAKPAGEA
ncbi:MAG: DivIVA domain-containing protein [Myxococcota bacterium]